MDQGEEKLIRKKGGNKKNLGDFDEGPGPNYFKSHPQLNLIFKFKSILS